MRIQQSSRLITNSEVVLSPFAIGRTHIGRDERILKEQT